jgi:hypothetical protein
MRSRVLQRGDEDVISFKRTESDTVNKMVNEVEEMIPLSHSSDNLFTGDVSPADDWLSKTLICGEMVPYLQATMMGSMLLIRLPWVISYCGIVLTIVLLAISIFVVGMTSLALGAIGSDGKLAKFSTLFALLDKNLGRELSSSICLIYTLGKVLSVGMYCLAGAEAALWRRGDYLSYPAYRDEKVVVALILCVCIFAICLFSRKWFITASGVMALVVAGLVYVSIFAGMVANFSNGGNHSLYIPSGGPDVADRPQQYHLYTLLGIVFPNFVGIIANLIRPEKLPQRQLPRPLGNMLGIGLIGLLCVIIAATYGAYVSTDELRENKLILAQLAWPTKYFVQAGIVATTTWAGLYATVTSIRCLQVVVRNKSFPFLSSLIPSRGRATRRTSVADDASNSPPSPQSSTSDVSDITNHIELKIREIPGDFDGRGIKSEQDAGNIQNTGAHVFHTVPTDQASLRSPTGAGRIASRAESSCCCSYPSFQTLAESSDVVFGADDVRVLACVFVLVAVPCLAGHLDILAPIVSVVYLFIYFTINTTCFMLAIMKGSVFKPRFGFESWWASLIGMTACFVVSLLLSWWLTVIVFTAFLALAVYAVQCRTVQDGFGDVLYGFFFQMARNILYKLDDAHITSASTQRPGTELSSGRRPVEDSARVSQHHLPDWRPKILVLVRTTEYADEVVASGRGLTRAASFLGGSATVSRQNSALYIPHSFPSSGKILSSSSAHGPPLSPQDPYRSQRSNSLGNAVHGGLTLNVDSNTANGSARGACKLRPDSASLIRLAGQIKTERGLTMAIAFVRGEMTTFDYQQAALTQAYITQFMKEEKVKGFSHVGVVSDVHLARQIAIQTAGIGPMVPNTVMTDWPDTWEDMTPAAAAQLVDGYKAAIAAKKALIVVKGASRLPKTEITAPDPAQSPSRSINGTEEGNDCRSTIDVWWVMYDGGLLMLIPHLLTLHAAWKTCQIRLFVVLTNSTDNPLKLKRRASAYLDSVGISAVVDTVDLTSSEDQCNSVYEQTLDFKSRVRLLEGMNALRGAANPTMTLAVRAAAADPVPGQSNSSSTTSQATREQPKRTHLADLFGDDGGANQSAGIAEGDKKGTTKVNNELSNPQTDKQLWTAPTNKMPPSGATKRTGATPEVDFLWNIVVCWLFLIRYTPVIVDQASLYQLQRQD